jgi:regulator of protease activity HflC (stomatin/prohibitin superfamily)
MLFLASQPDVGDFLVPLGAGILGFVVFLFLAVKTVQTGNVAVVTMFGKYRRILEPGLNFMIPFLERVNRTVSVQNRSAEMSFQAITNDQANVYFKAMLLYAVVDQREQTIINVAFKFINNESFYQTLVRTVEGAVRSFVATKRQSEILSLRGEIVGYVKSHLDQSLESWGYHLIDVQINDIVFDQTVLESMARVVASQNMLAAAENEGKALLITKTRAAEADGNAVRIQAEAERTAQQLRGQGIALFREEAAKGMSIAAKEMSSAGLGPSLILFQMWTEAIRHVAEHGRGNTIFLDGSAEGMQQNLRQILALEAQREQREAT